MGAYPLYPNNRLIVGGTDLTTKFKMVLVDGYTLSPPSPKTYIVDIPGGNGKLDLTESLLGDTAYENREQKFTFYVINTYQFESIKTEVSNFLHGKAFDYIFTRDPEYTYHGRFTVNSYEHEVYSVGLVGIIEINIDADPYKYKKTQIYRVPAVAGYHFDYPSGRKRVCPIIETNGPTKVIFNNKLYTLYAGTWRLNEILFTNGKNALYLSTYDVRILSWGELNTNAVTWGQFRTKRLYEWYRSDGSSNPVFKLWRDMSVYTWEDLAESTWADQMFKPEDTSDIADVYVKYEWGDL